MILWLVVHQFWNDFVARKSNTFGSRKKLVTLISRSLASRLSSLVSLRSKLEIPIHVIGLDRRHRHPPFDTALQGSRLIEREIVHGLRPQEIDDVGEPRVLHILRQQCVSVRVPSSSGGCI